jgi:hypothetical protein
LCFRALLAVTLVTYVFTNVFDCFSNFAADFTSAFLYFTAGVFFSALVGEFLVIESAADSFFCFTFYLIQFPFNFIPIR